MNTNSMVRNPSSLLFFKPNSARFGRCPIEMKYIWFGCSLLMFLMMVSIVNGEQRANVLLGSIISSKDGSVSGFKYEQVSSDMGRMCADNGATNEHFSGQYSKLSKTSTGVIRDIYGMTAGSITTGGNGYTVKGFLRGNKGTTISLAVDMVKEVYTQDHGVGEGTDNKGVLYQVVVTPRVMIVPVSQFSSMANGGTATTGNLGVAGIGAQLKRQDGRCVIARVLPESGAAHAGLKAGDIITHVDSKDVSSLEISEITSLIRGRGKPDTQVMLTITRVGISKPKHITVMRQPLNLQ